MDLNLELQRVWDDQRAFNLLFRPNPDTSEEMTSQARDFVLFTGSEMHELLRTLPWKKHRRMPHFRGNESHLLEEGADVFKCALSLLQIIGVKDWEHLINLYWRKTAVVRQRYREEWINKLDGAAVVVDIDNVLCDYVTGLGQWLLRHTLSEDPIAPRVRALMATGGYINAASLGIPEERWQAMKHSFRVSGAKRTLPVFPDAKPFLERCAAVGLRIVLLTSRPVDTYQNIYTDTILWLNDNQLPFDFVWWAASDKAERILQMEGLREKIFAAVDDEARFVDQMCAAGISTFWLHRYPTTRVPSVSSDRYTEITSLSEIGN
jgi:hypothetical protein